jgi:hypothetical protein
MLRRASGVQPFPSSNLVVLAKVPVYLYVL